MSDWKECKLGDLIEIKYGKDHKNLSDGLIPLYGSGGIMRYVEKSIYDNESILIPRKGSLNNIFYINKPFWTVDTLFWSKINNNKVIAKYLFYQLTTMDFNSMNVGSAVPSLTVSVLNEIDINLPPLEEQKSIASILSSLDDKIDLLHRQNKTLESMAETIFRQWFFEEENEDWEDSCLENIIDFNPNYSLKKNSVSTYLEMSNVSNSSFFPENWYEREFNSGMKFKNGDTLFARITPCLENGKTCFVSFLKENEVGWGSTEYIVMRMKEQFHPFISYVIAKNKDFREFAMSSMSGSSGRQRAQVEVIKKYDIKIPPTENILKINNEFDLIFKKLQINSNQIKTLEKMRDNLLPKLMSGEIRVEQDLKD